MQENNFEKRVQAQMEELRFRPSQAVWEKVEEEIRKRKKRRIIFFFSLLAGLGLLGYTGYFLFTPTTTALAEQKTESPASNKTHNESDKFHKGTNEIVGSDKKSVEVEESAAPNIPVDETKEKQTQPPHVPVDLNIPGKNTPAKSETGNTLKQERNKPTIQASEQNTTTAPLQTDNLVIKRRNSRDDKNVTVVKKGIKKAPAIERIGQNKVRAERRFEAKDVATSNETLKDRVITPTNSTIAVPVDSTARLLDSAVIAKPSSTNLADSLQENPAAITNAAADADPAIPAKTKTPRVEFGLEFSYGIAADRENAFPVANTQKALMDQLNNAPPVNFGTPAASAIYYLPPASIKSGTAFRVGIIASTRLTRRSKLSTGLRYAYFSHQLTMGGFKDTAVSFSNSYLQNVSPDAIYRGFQQRSYVNKFHFLQVPVQYELQLNKGKKTPLSWNIGLSAGYLLNTNAIVYDSSAHGRYYHDKKAFNKLQWNVNTGFSFRFGIRNKIQWSVGPEISLGMNKLMKDGYTPTQYLLYGGVTGRIFLTKKK